MELFHAGHHHHHHQIERGISAKALQDHVTIHEVKTQELKNKNQLLFVWFVCTGVLSTHYPTIDCMGQTFGGKF